MDGHKHIILIDLSSIAVAIQRVAETTALFDPLYAHPKTEINTAELFKIIQNSKTK